MNEKERVVEITKLLREKFPNPKTELNFSNPYQLVCAVILAAMCTDKLVNKITPEFFKRFPDPKTLANADIEEIKKYISSVNFYNNKAKSLSGMAKTLVVEYGGVVPSTMEKLMRLPGVARKSANVILNEVFDIAQGFVVDTHVTRVSQRLGLTMQKDPVKIEQDLMKAFDKKDWRLLSGAIVLHGRYTCTARKPNCAECVLNKVCPSAFKV
ncbi:endonuclease III [candidate division WWE3 bacterium RIFCSPHIGHO2_01_FULL_40_23]|uniref:Endonuclease III n=1 Tax=candidate division WWE3 bacterium RIFCSPLOWO2_01_FULL_41_18 TaxID=1802625 RepID=A0A1F4VFR5_UNCKA|nr:MAG: endonuclease III [candidate division WWE3 bacterium RIFCSPHIGHO2_01_FULL_40_23]OGC55768.1 MAG: endonuclease III [candidate division WWE3 bacterium RIFCSPLOWO2_01_FULL_41_18]